MKVPLSFSSRLYRLSRSFWVIATAAIVLPSNVFADWTGLGTNDNWSTSGNWSAGVPSNDGTAIVNFAGTTRLTPYTDQAWSINGINFKAGAGSFVLSGQTLVMGGGEVINNSANTQTINNNIILFNDQKFYSSSGNLIFNGNVGTGEFTLTTDTKGASFNITINGQITGLGNLSKISAGTLTLNGQNSYSGSTTIAAGSVVLGASQALNGGLTLSGGTLNLNGQNASFGNGLTVSANSIVDFGQNLSSTLTITGGLSLTRTVTINNWTPNDHFYLPDPGANANKFVFTGYAGGATWQNGEITPTGVPEPASAALLTMSLAGFGIRHWRARAHAKR